MKRPSRWCKGENTIIIIIVIKMLTTHVQVLRYEIAGP